MLFNYYISSPVYITFPSLFSMLYRKEANSRNRKSKIVLRGGGTCSIIELKEEICRKYLSQHFRHPLLVNDRYIFSLYLKYYISLMKLTCLMSLNNNIKLISKQRNTINKLNSDLTNIISTIKSNTRTPAWSLYILEIAIGRLLSRPPWIRKETGS